MGIDGVPYGRDLCVRMTRFSGRRELPALADPLWRGPGGPGLGGPARVVFRAALHVPGHTPKQDRGIAKAIIEKVSPVVSASGVR